jgi:hypothetical protein
MTKLVKRCALTEVLNNDYVQVNLVDKVDYDIADMNIGLTMDLRIATFQGMTK